VIRQKLQLFHLHMLFQAMNFQASMIVDVRILFLRNSEKHFIVKPLHISDSFLELNFAAQFSGLPVEGSNMSLFATDEQVPTVSSVVDRVGAKVLERQIEVLEIDSVNIASGRGEWDGHESHLMGAADIDVFCNHFLRIFVRLFNPFCIHKTFQKQRKDGQTFSKAL
jgi:hypothetical protein